MIDRISIAADTTWSAGPIGATIDCDVTVEAIQSDARSGSESDGLVVAMPITLARYLDPPPLGRTCTVIQDDETLAEGIITEIDIDAEGIRMQVDL